MKLSLECLSVLRRGPARCVPVGVGLCLAWFTLPVCGGVSTEVQQAVNLLANPSFETGEDACPVDWVFLNQHEMSRGEWKAGDAPEGAQHIRAIGESGMCYGRWTTAYRLELEPGRTYRLGFWHRGTGGAQVYLEGHHVEFDSDSGVLTENLRKRYKSVLVKPESSVEWRYYTAVWQAPDYPSWARLNLGIYGRHQADFDWVTLTADGLHLVQPADPVLVESGGLISVEAFLQTDQAEGEAEWTCATPGVKIIESQFDATRGTWRLTLRADEVGFFDLEIEARLKTGATHAATRPGFIRVHPPLKGTFAFSVFTDAHFYRPGDNPRNEMFGGFAKTVTALDPLFFLSLGDQMEIHSGASDLDKKWSVAAVREQFARLRAPVFTLLGNHEIDKTFEGAGTRWYWEQHLGMSPFKAFRIENYLFAGIDTSTPGIYGRDHGGSFVRPGQRAWLDEVLTRAGKAGLVPVVLMHIPVYGEFRDGADRNDLLDLLYRHRVRLVLQGHQHYSEQYAAPYPSFSPWPPAQWPTRTELVTNEEVIARLNDPSNTVFLTTTTVSAFLLGGSPYNGFRHFWVKDGNIVWQDVVPVSLAVSVERREDGQIVRLRTGPEKALAGFPVKAELPAGRVEIRSGEKILPVHRVLHAQGQTVWTQVDLPVNTESEVIFRVVP